MKILHLSSERTWRGGEQQIAYLVEESLRLGLEVLVAGRSGSAFEDYCKRGKVPFFGLPFSGEISLRTAFGIRRICQEEGVDFVHMHSSHSHAMGVLSSIFGNRAKLILSRRVDVPMRSNVLSRFKFNYRGIEKIVCVSDAIKEVMRPDLNDPEKLVTVHSGIDLARFEGTHVPGKLRKEFNVPADVPIVGNVSALADHKDYPTYLKVCRELKDQGVEARFFMIGGGPLQEELRKLVKELEIEDRVVMTGHRSDIPEIMGDLDVFLMTSKTEGLGTTVLDAFANRIPVVATRGGGIPEMIEDGVSGYLSEIGDYKNLARQVLVLLQEEERRVSFAEHAFETLRKGFTKEETARRTVAIYREVLEANQDAKREGAR
jgi:glycosyltransferase involved in cell wall biosynthesis